MPFAAPFANPAPSPFATVNPFMTGTPVASQTVTTSTFTQQVGAAPAANPFATNTANPFATNTANPFMTATTAPFAAQPAPFATQTANPFASMFRCNLHSNF